jgi:NTE family protein
MRQTNNILFKRHFLAVFFLLIFIIINPFFNPVFAQDKKGGVAFALSGGGSKGIAQIGCLKVLEEEGIRPELITGTSIGSILGGLYSIGYSIEDLENLAGELDWEYYFNDELERIHYPVEERFATDRYQVGFPIKDGKIVLPTGFVKGQKISLLLSRLTIPAHGITNFDEFEIPFRAIATDFETGQAVVYGSGDLADALRASMSIPSVFEPCAIDGKLLIDGGVARNLPVEDALEMGAETVIGIDIGAPLYKKEQLASVLDILDQTSSFRVVESNLKQAELADIIIRPNVADISALSFDQNDTLMARGQRAAIKMLPEIQRLITNPVSSERGGIEIPQEVNVVAFEVGGCLDKEVIGVKNLLQIRTPKVYKLDDIENRIKKLYGSGLVKMASYRLLKQEENGYKLIINVTTQKGEFIKLSANYDSRLKAGLLFNLTLRNRIFNGSKFSLDLKVSESPAVIVDYLAYTARRPNIGWHVGGKAHSYQGLTYIDGSKDEQFRMRHFSAEANIFSALNNRFLVSAGIGAERYVKAEEFFDPDEENQRLHQTFLQAEFLRDTYDRIHFPTDGSKVVIEGKYAFARKLELVDSDTTSAIASRNSMLRLQATKIFSVSKRINPFLSFDGGYIHEVENNFLNRFYLGRAIPNEVTHVESVGLNYMEKPVSAYGQVGLKMQIETLPNIFTSPMFNYTYYQLKSLQVNETGITDEVITEKDSFFGAGIELGWLTVIGPAIITAEYNFSETRMNYSLHLGYVF